MKIVTFLQNKSMKGDRILAKRTPSLFFLCLRRLPYLIAAIFFGFDLKKKTFFETTFAI